MTTRKRKQIEGWKYTREGRKAHYFTPDRDELERSLCGYLYYTGHLDSISMIRSKCIRCERLLNEIAALPPPVENEVNHETPHHLGQRVR